MTKETWVKRIRKATKEAGTYRPYFENLIFSLAETLEQRDKVKKYYTDSGAEPIVQHVNKSGNANIVKNPILVMYDDLNNTALMYWRELGLTPRSLKQIDEKAMKAAPSKNTLEKVFENMGI